MKYKSNLRSHISLFTLVPGVICSLLIGAYLTYALVRDVNQYEQDMGKAYGEQVSSQAFIPASTGDVPALQNIAQLALEYPLVHAISFYDTHQQVLAHAGPRHQSIAHSDVTPFSNQSVAINYGANRQLFTPIFKPRLSTSLDKKGSYIPADTTEITGWVRIEFSQSFMLLHKYKTILIDIVIVAIVLACAFWFSTPFSDRLAGTIRALSQSAREISDGNTTVTMPNSDVTELNELGQAIDNMRSAIAEQQAGLQQHIEQSTRDLRETLETIEIQNIELDLARREAVQASRVKSEFLANTSHEIRTPLNSILGFSRLLLKTPLSTQQQDYLQNIRKSSENLLTIINDVLDLSKIEAGKLVLDYMSFDLQEILEEILQILAPGAHEKGLELLHMFYSDVPRQLLGDPLRLKQVLTNLISNAIKFSDQGNIVVRVAVEKNDSQQALLKIDVSDSGKGLPNNETSIFNAFSQLDSSSTREYGGTGLGLAISKKLVEQMGGDIGYSSEAGNTTFWFTVRFDIATHTTPATEYKDLIDRQVLIYDREPLCRLALSHSLTDWGTHPVLADSIEQVLPAVSRHAASSIPLDAVILGLPVKHQQKELELMMACIEQLSAQYHCPVLLCIPTSAKHSLPDTLQAAVHHLPKPVTTRRLYSTLCHSLGLKSTASMVERSDSHQASSHTQSLRVLTVDDNLSNLKLISTLLRDMGVSVLEAQNGHEALQVFQEQQPDLIFMDIQMPIMDGIEATKKIRQLEKQSGNGKKHTPIIALTAHALAEQRQHLLMSGLDDYLSKPATEQQLLRALEKWQAKQESNIRSPAAYAPLPPDEGWITCIDKNAALKSSGGRTEIAIEMLGLLLKNLPQDRELINAALHSQDLIVAQEHIHKLHGACCYCGVPELKNCCNAMESILKKNLTAHIGDVLTAFNRAVDRLLAWQQRNSLHDFFHS